MDDDSIIANYTYSPSHLVRYTHNLLHLDSSLRPVSNEFSITYDSYWNSYSQSLLPVPIICMVLGLVAVLVLQIVLCARMCVYSCRCLPKFNGDEVSATTVSQAMGPRFNLLVVMFIFFGLSTIFVDQMLIFGSVSLTKGVNRGIDALDFVHDTFTDLTNYGNNLTTYGNELDYNLAQADSTGCTQALTLQNYLPQYFGYVDDYLSYVEPVPDKCDDASNGLQKYGVHYKNASVWVLYGMIMVGIALYSLGMICKSKVTLKCGIGITELLMLVLFLLIGVEMVIVMGLSDFCMDPVVYTNNLVPRSIYDVTYYYTTCYGTNPFQSDIDSLNQFVVDFDTALNQLEAACPSNTYVDACFPILDAINSTVIDINAEIACPPIQDQLDHVLNDGLCDKSFKGLFLIWLGQYISTGLLLAATIVISLTYQYFGQYWSDIDSSAARPNDSILFLDTEITAVPPSAEAQPYYNTTSTMHLSPPPSASYDKTDMLISP